MSGGLVYNRDVLLDPARHDFTKKAAVIEDNPDEVIDKKTTKDTPVYFWYLKTSSDTVKTTPPYTQSFSRMRDDIGPETVINVEDGRTEVPEQHFKDKDGKYRAIVKLFLLYERQSQFKDNEATWPIATGWLVAPDLVVTAGHCAFDHSHGLGRLVKAKAYIGYKGYKNHSNREDRWGTAVATTVKWLEGVGDEPSDLSVIKLSSPFTTVSKFFQWKQTPISKNAAELGIVGYPGDIMNNGERGARMYEMFASTTYNLADSDRNMLQYKLDTYGGNSGSPVFHGEKSLVAIGVHVLGGYLYNSASVFGGRYGNRFQALQITASALTTEGDRPTEAKQPHEDKKWLWEITQRTTEAQADLAQQMLIASMTEAQKVVAAIPDDILHANPSGLCFGPDFGPEISILASTAIATAGRLAADSRSGSDAESLASTRLYDGIVGRALLAEAALQFYSTKRLPSHDKDKIQEFMAPVVAGLTPFVVKVAPRLLKGMLEPSLRLLLSRVAGKTSLNEVREHRKPGPELDTGFGRQLDGKELEFFNTLMDHAQKNDENVESFYSTLTTIGDFIGSAFKKAGPVLVDVAKIGLPLLLGPESGVGSSATDLDSLAHRAIVAEACLQSFVQLHTELSLGDKGLFRHLLAQVKALGPKIVNVAPHAVQLVGPIVGDILREIEEKKKADEKK